MKVIVEKREIVGTLKTPLGNYELLSRQHVYHEKFDITNFDVVDVEGFSVSISVRTDYILIPASVPFYVDVKRILTDEEEQPVELLTHATID